MALLGNEPIDDTDSIGLSGTVVRGAPAAIISWVPSLGAATQASVFAQTVSLAERRGTPLNVAQQLLLRGGLAALDNSANAAPPQYIGMVSPIWPDMSKEHRGYVAMQPVLHCDCNGHVSDAQINASSSHPGFTPRPFQENSAAGFLRGYDEAEPHPVFNGQVTMRPLDPPSSRKPFTCVTYVQKGSSRLSGFGQWMNRRMFGVPPPWIWREIEYTVCCSGQITIRYKGSHVPNHKAYYAGVALSPTHAFTNLAGFMLSGPVLVPGQQFAIHQESVVPEPE
jgi:hypothetical protein